MSDNFEQRVRDAIANPKNVGELAGADAVGTVGSPGCGDLMRMWIKFKEQNGRKVIDKASFQSFGCETAIAVASLATEILQGKTPEEALALRGEQLAPDLGPLPPMKIHCSQLVEEALRQALQPAASTAAVPAAPAPAPAATETLMDSLTGAGRSTGGRKIVFLQ
jgi:NifU-like protein involved in Fe-S cluster formation